VSDVPEPGIDDTTALHRLLEAARTLPPDRLDEAVRLAAAKLGATEVDLLLVDYSQTVLVSYNHSRRAALAVADDDDVHLISATIAGRVFATTVPRSRGSCPFSTPRNAPAYWHSPLHR
jgi:hypothetical protein